MSDELVSNLVDDSPIPPKGVRKPKAAEGLPETIRIVLEESDEIPPTGLFVGHNGRGYLIRPGEPVDIPLAVKEVLDHAVMSAAQVDAQTQTVIGYRERRRYNYTVLTS